MDILWWQWALYLAELIAIFGLGVLAASVQAKLIERADRKRNYAKWDRLWSRPIRMSPDEEYFARQSGWKPAEDA